MPTVTYEGRGTEHIVQWAGALLQRPHRAVAAQRGAEPRGALVSFIWPGSPASRYRLAPLSRIVALDGQPVADLDEFLRLIVERNGQQSVRLKVLNLLGREKIITLKPDNRYWPIREIRWAEGDWRRIEHGEPEISVSLSH